MKSERKEDAHPRADRGEARAPARGVVIGVLLGSALWLLLLFGIGCIGARG